MKFSLGMDDITIWNVGLPLTAIALAVLANQYLERMFNGRSFQVKIPMGTRGVIICDPDCVEHILKTRFSLQNYIKGPQFHDVLYDLFGDGIFNVDGEKWKQQRKMISRMFSANEFRNTMANAFKVHAEPLRRKFDDASEKGYEFDVSELFHNFTLDSIGEIAFGTNIDAMNNPDLPFVRAFTRAQCLLVQRFCDPLWKLKDRLGFHSELRDLVRVMDEFAYGLIKKRKCTAYTTSDDALSRFMKMEDKNGKQLLSDKELRDIVLGLLLAGRDSTAQALSWAIYLIFQHPDVEEKIKEEVDRVLGDSIVPSYDCTKKMTYIPAVIKETLRLYPSVPKNSKLAVEDDTLPDGTFIPSGTDVVYFPYGMGRLSHLWKDPYVFNPERFVNDPKPSMAKYPVFQAGPRTCLGQDMAIFEASTVLGTIYKQFHLDVTNKKAVRPENSLSLPMRHPLMVKVSRR